MIEGLRRAPLRRGALGWLLDRAGPGPLASAARNAGAQPIAARGAWLSALGAMALVILSAQAASRPAETQRQLGAADATFAEGASALPGGGASAPADRTREAGAAGPAEEGAAPPASPAETDKPPPAAGESPADGGSSSLAEAGSEPGDRTGEPRTSPGAAEEAAARPEISPAESENPTLPAAPAESENPTPPAAPAPSDREASPADSAAEEKAPGPAQERSAPSTPSAEAETPSPREGEAPADGASAPEDRAKEPGPTQERSAPSIPSAEAETPSPREGEAPADGASAPEDRAKEPGAPAGERDARRADRRRGVYAALLWLSAIVVCLVTAIVIRAARRSRCRRRATGGSAPRVERRTVPLELDDTIGGATAADLDARLGPDQKGARAEEAESLVRRASREAEELARAGDERGALLAPLDIPDGEGEQEDLDPGAAPGRRT